MRYLFLLASVGVASLALAQGSSRVPAHLRNRSVTTRQVITQELYVDGGTTYNGTLAAPKVETPILDAGQAWVGTLGNPDGGEVYAPAGLAVDPASELCLNFPSCTQRIRGVGVNILVEPGTGRFVVTDGATFNTDVQAGNTSTNGVNLAGGATGATVKTSGGATPSADAGLYLQAGAPNGHVSVIHESGLLTPAIGNSDAGDVRVGLGFGFPFAAPPSAAPTGGISNIRAIPIRTRSDGGVETAFVGFDGQDYAFFAVDNDYTFYVPAGLPPGNAIWDVPPELSTGSVRILAFTSQATGGTGVTELVTNQLLPDGGLNVLCRSMPIPCNTVPNARYQSYCADNRWYMGPMDGGVLRNIVTAWDAGCSGGNNPGGSFFARVKTRPCLPGIGPPCGW